MGQHHPLLQHVHTAQGRWPTRLVLILYFIPLVNIVVLVMVNLDLAYSFGNVSGAMPQVWRVAALGVPHQLRGDSRGRRVATKQRKGLSDARR